MMKIFSSKNMILLPNYLARIGCPFDRRHTDRNRTTISTAQCRPTDQSPRVSRHRGLYRIFVRHNFWLRCPFACRSTNCFGNRIHRRPDSQGRIQSPWLKYDRKDPVFSLVRYVVRSRVICRIGSFAVCVRIIHCLFRPLCAFIEKKKSGLFQYAVRAE